MNADSRTRAVTPEEKEEVLRRLGEVWARFPQLRLGQLIANALDDGMLRRVEDFQLAAGLEKFYDSYRPPRFTPEGWK